MKNRIINTYSFALLAIVGSLTACDKQLDLAPEDTTVESEVFQTSSSAESALMDVYNKTYEANKQTAYIIGDITTNTFVPTSAGAQLLSSGNLLTDDYSAEKIWGDTYSAINVANVIIKSVPELGTYNEDLEKQHVAEAKFLRAYNYLVLLKLYGDGALQGNMSGLGLPLQLEPYAGTEFVSNNALERSSNDEVYAQIIKDLTDALPDLNEDYDDKLETRARATQGSVHALLSRVYLYMGNYAKAAEESAYLINNPIYALVSNLRSVFPITDGIDEDLVEEHIYAIPLTYNGGDHQFGTHWFFYYSRTFGYVSDDYLGKLSSTDQRMTELMWSGNSLSSENYGKLTTSKFNHKDGRDNIPMIRLPEMYLTRAEALARTDGKVQEAVDLLNRIARRADAAYVDYKLSDFTTAEDLIDRILLEREKELAFEGLHRYDIIRTGRKLQFKNTDGVYEDVPAGRYVLPIPKREIDITKGSLVQNPGYL
ncbi:RagB/SusD family nutrient uptake outer membrane protein [Ancylomarina euxinus]|uniref:RagB/SusD family nutrient uptake outer membrane protein n=1 Tax=Ancylomarina euxinus TaxID=2283627 RepID=A0A425XZY6_9BACT|nr:RagB/SusD family nutrient uptake outer membrane protein [Ancylomarina euxinus]MCZ4695400.1 RagB/SusD family nutrient uptake outer membrane protein [Ancylomarina euxinus]MUP15596.1 RagB/SusD family nutrient uptake outer membrane protein [Ancylomarina euxinus]RRG20963.1 RagB/SusD family nutrient uptake outer membrane protein [Ancylomarina euxinus]